MDEREQNDGPENRSAPAPRRFFPVLIATIILMIALFIVQASVSSGGSFSLTVAGVLAKQDSLVGRNVKIEGRIKEGSVRTGKDEFDIYFVIEDEDKNQLEIHYTKVLPDPFKEGRTAIVEGELRENAKIEASRLTVKCPSKYKREDMSKEEYEDYLRKNPDHIEPRS